MALFFIIPGYGESPNGKAYRKIALAAKKKGHIPVPIEVDWRKNKSMSLYVKETKQKIRTSLKNQKDKDIQILGFSFGAYIAALLTRKYYFQKIYFCSMSPYFKDDFSAIPTEWKKKLGKKMLQSLQKYKFPTTSKCSAVFLVGKKEPPISINRFHKSYRQWRGRKKKFIIEKSDHDIGNAAYLKKVLEVIN